MQKSSLGGFQLRHQKLLDFQNNYEEEGGGATANQESLERLMAELFFCRENVHIKLKHSESATEGGVSRAALCKCARTTLTRHFGLIQATKDQKKEACDKLTARGPSVAAVPAQVRNHDPQGGQCWGQHKPAQSIKANECH